MQSPRKSTPTPIAPIATKDLSELTDADLLKIIGSIHTEISSPEILVEGPLPVSPRPIADLRGRSHCFEARDVAAEIIRRAGGPSSGDARYVLVSDPPTAEEPLELLAATLQGVSVLLVPRKPMTEEQWIARYCTPEA